jgi:hypothetical protein
MMVVKPYAIVIAIGACITLSVVVGLGLRLSNQPSLVESKATIDSQMRVVKAVVPRLPANLHFGNEWSSSSEFSEGLASVWESTGNGRRFGFVDESGKLVIKPAFASVEPFHDGLAAVKLPVDPFMSGFIDRTGKLVIEPKYMFAGDFSNGIAAVSSNNWSWLIDKNGRQLTEERLTHDFPRIVGNVAIVYSYSARKYGIVNSRGERIVPPEYSYITVGDTDMGKSGWLCLPTGSNVTLKHFLLQNNNELWGMADSTGKILFAPRFERIIDSNIDHVVVKTKTGYGIVDLKGDYTVDPKYDDITEFGQLTGAKSNRKWRMISADGRVLPQKIDAILRDPCTNRWFSDGLGPVIKEGRCGYVNKDGEFAIPPQFDFARPFSEGFAPVVQSGYWRFIDTKGNLLPAKYADVSHFSSGTAKVTIAGPLYPFAKRAEMEKLTRDMKSRRESESDND